MEPSRKKQVARTRSQTVQITSRRVLEAGFALIIGNLTAALRPSTAVWLFVAVAILYGLTYLWDLASGEFRRWLVAGCVGASLFFIYKAYRDYVGANYRLSYQLCGGAVGNDQNQLAGAKIHVQIGNPSSEALFYTIKGHYHAFDRIVSRQPYTDIDKSLKVTPDKYMPVWASRPGWEDTVVYKTPVTASAGQLIGDYRFEIKYGLDADNPAGIAVIAGKYFVTFDDTGQPDRPSRFAPLGDKNIIFNSAECEIGPDQSVKY